jgi:hypothetical protein
MEVDGVAGEVAFGPSPVAILDDETGKGVTNFFPIMVLAFLSS